VTDIFEEVDQSLREDSLGTIWKRWQWVVYGVVAVAIIGVAVFEFMRWQRSSEIDNDARIYDSAFVAREANDLTTARNSFAQLESDNTGFKVLAGHMLAGVEQELTGDSAAVEAHLAAAAAASKGVMSDLALLKLGYAKADTAPLAELEKDLKPLLDRTGYAAALARELIASKAMADGDVVRARAEYELLSANLESPQGMQQRVQQALAILPARVVNLDNPAPALPAAPPPAVSSPAQPAQAPQQ
jgi:hypothetical protein